MAEEDGSASRTVGAVRCGMWTILSILRLLELVCVRRAVMHCIGGAVRQSLARAPSFRSSSPTDLLRPSASPPREPVRHKARSLAHRCSPDRRHTQKHTRARAHTHARAHPHTVCACARARARVCVCVCVCVVCVPRSGFGARQIEDTPSDVQQVLLYQEGLY